MAFIYDQADACKELSANGLNILGSVRTSARLESQRSHLHNMAPRQTECTLPQSHNHSNVTVMVAPSSCKYFSSSKYFSKRHLASSKLLLDWSAWDVIWAIRLLDALIAWNSDTDSWHLPITDKWYSATAVGCLRGHCVEASDDGDDTPIQKDESKRADGNNGVEKDLVLRLPLNISILINRCRR